MDIAHTYIENPIQNGYLVTFLESELDALRKRNFSFKSNYELKEDKIITVMYILELYYYKDLFQGSHICLNISAPFIKESNLKTEADLIFKDAPDSDTWRKSNGVKFNRVTKYAKRIWYKFLSESSDYQVYISRHALSVTIYRLQNLDKYGSSAFDLTFDDKYFNEILLTEIMPRFLISPHYKTMCIRLETLCQLPSKDQLIVQPPSLLNTTNLLYSNDNDTSNKSSKKRLEKIMYDVFHCGELYQSFLKYSKNIDADAKVNLMIMIYNFKYHIGSENIEAENLAWNIYRFFLATGSSFDISISKHKRDEIMRKLSSPDIYMFLPVERLLCNDLLMVYTGFTKTKEFKQSLINLNTSEYRLPSNKLEYKENWFERWKRLWTVKKSRVYPIVPISNELTTVNMTSNPGKAPTSFKKSHFLSAKTENIETSMSVKNNSYGDF